MDSRKYVFKETGVIAVGQAICVGIMYGVFALILPLAFNQPILTVAEFFRKKGEPKA